MAVLKYYCTTYRSNDENRSITVKRTASMSPDGCYSMHAWLPAITPKFRVAQREVDQQP